MLVFTPPYNKLWCYKGLCFSRFVTRYGPPLNMGFWYMSCNGRKGWWGGGALISIRFNNCIAVLYLCFVDHFTYRAYSYCILLFVSPVNIWCIRWQLNCLYWSLYTWTVVPAIQLYNCRKCNAAPIRCSLYFTYTSLPISLPVRL